MARIKVYDHILLRGKLVISVQLCVQEEEEKNYNNQLLSFFSGLPVCLPGLFITRTNDIHLILKELKQNLSE